MIQFRTHSFRFRTHLFFTLIAVLALVARAGAQSLLVQCKLQDGSLYTATVGADARWDMPAGKPSPRTPDGRILGVHAVEWTSITPDLVRVALRVSNAATNADGTGHCGKVYYESIGLRVAGEGDPWKIATDVERAPLPWLVAPGQHVFTSGAAFIRRLVLYRGRVTPARAQLELERVPPFDASAAFGPTKIRLPAIDVHAQELRFAAKLKSLRAALAAGNPDPPDDLRTKAMGPFQPVGDDIAYEHGGQGIFFVWGWEQAPSAALFWRTVGDLVVERMRFVYDRRTGARITPEQWAAARKLPFQPFSVFLHGDSDQVNTEGRHEYLPPAFDSKDPAHPNAAPAFNSGVCPYEGALAAYDAYDGAHRIRALGPWIASFALLRDPVARECLLDDANWCRMSWCDIGQPAGPWQSGLPTMRSWMGGKLHQGAPALGREFGWVCFGEAAALWCATPADPEYRALARNAGALLALRDDAAMPNGLPQRASAGGISGAWETKESGGGAVPKDRDLAQSFEQAIVWRALLALALYVKPPADQLALIAHGARNLYDNPAFADQPTPPKYVTVAKNGGTPVDPLAEGWNLPSEPFGDPTHVDAMVAALYRASGDQRWLDILRRGKPCAEQAAAFRQLIANPPAGFEPAWAVEACAVLDACKN